MSSRIGLRAALVTLLVAALGPATGGTAQAGAGSAAKGEANASAESAAKTSGRPVWTIPGEEPAFRKPAAKASAGAKASAAAKASPTSTPSPTASPSATPSASPSVAAPSKKPTRVIPPVLQEIEKRYSEAGSLSANFKQLTETKTTQQKKESSGVILAKPPGKVRWETLSPDKNLLVSDGKTFWFYTPPFDESEPGQLIEKKASQVQSRLAAALLSGQFSREKAFRIQEKSQDRFLLIPKRGAAGTVKEAEIRVDLEKKIITQVILRHRGGNVSDITLSDVKLGEPLDERLFGFVAPPNTERIRE